MQQAAFSQGPWTDVHYQALKQFIFSSNEPAAAQNLLFLEDALMYQHIDSQATRWNCTFAPFAAIAQYKRPSFRGSSDVEDL